MKSILIGVMFLGCVVAGRVFAERDTRAWMVGQSAPHLTGYYADCEGEPDDKCPGDFWVHRTYECQSDIDTNCVEDANGWTTRYTTYTCTVFLNTHWCTPHSNVTENLALKTVNCN